MARSTLYEDFLGQMKERGGIQEGTRVLVACSGGPDSVALLDIFVRYAPTAKIKVFACHLNHCLRGADSDEDERFVRALAKRMGVEVHVGRSDVEALMRERRLSTEMAAREARYEFFIEAAAKMRCSIVATAHNLNDNAETILQRLIEGSGLDGLSGIPGWRRLTTEKHRYLIRPLLFASRARIEDYLASRDLQYRIDKTNLEPGCLRNRIRLEIMPKLQEINPSVEEALVRAGDLVGHFIDYVGEDVNQAIRRITISAADGVTTLSCHALTKAPRVIACEALRQVLVGAGVTWRELKAAHVDAMLDLASGRSPSARADLPGCLQARRLYDKLFVGTLAALAPLEAKGVGDGAEGSSETSEAGEDGFGGFYQTLGRPGGVTLPGGLGEVAAVETTPQWFRLDEFRKSKNEFEEAIDADAVQGDCAVRFGRPGDRFRPLGAPGERKIQDVLVDAKIPAATRARIPILEDTSGIIWVAGVRIADRVKVTPQTTRILHLTWLNAAR